MFIFIYKFCLFDFKRGGNVDKYIKILIIKISQKYKITITNIMTYDDEDNRIKNIFKILIKEKYGKNALCEKTVYNKRSLISELMKWQQN